MSGVPDLPGKYSPLDFTCVKSWAPAAGQKTKALQNIMKSKGNLFIEKYEN